MEAIVVQCEQFAVSSIGDNEEMSSGRYSWPRGQAFKRNPLCGASRGIGVASGTDALRSGWRRSVRAGDGCSAVSAPRRRWLSLNFTEGLWISIRMISMDPKMLDQPARRPGRGSVISWHAGESQKLSQTRLYIWKMPRKRMELCIMGTLRIVWSNNGFQFLSDKESRHVRRWRNDCHFERRRRGPIQAVAQLWPARKLRFGNSGDNSRLDEIHAATGLAEGLDSSESPPPCGRDVRKVP